MKTSFSILLIALLLTPHLLVAAIPSGYDMSGQGEIRYLGFIKVYDATLYVPPGTVRDEILAAGSSRCLKLDYSVDLSVENFIEAADSILAEQHDPQTIAAVKNELDLLNSNYRDVKENDSYTLCYDGDTRQTSLSLNGNELVIVPTAEFAAIYFGIWLGSENPINDDLRDDLLSGLARGES